MQATFGGGCFWCTEVIFQKLEGVNSVLPGYMGGQRENPTYEQVCTGATGHVEVIHIDFDESVISYRQLLLIFFKTHNPTTLNRQGADVGTQYRSVVFYHDDQQKAVAETVIRELEEEKVFADPIVTAVEPATVFWEAEDYHHDYFNNNPQNQYCQLVVAPKLKKFLDEYQK